MAGPHEGHREQQQQPNQRQRVYDVYRMADPVVALRQELAPAHAEATVETAPSPVARPSLRELVEMPAATMEACRQQEFAQRLVAPVAGLSLRPALAMPFAVHMGPGGPTVRAGGLDLGAPPDAAGQYVGLRFQLVGERATVGVGIKATPVEGAPSFGTTVGVPLTKDDDGEVPR